LNFSGLCQIVIVSLDLEYNVNLCIENCFLTVSYNKEIHLNNI